MRSKTTSLGLIALGLFGLSALAAAPARAAEQGSVFDHWNDWSSGESTARSADAETAAAEAQSYVRDPAIVAAATQQQAQQAAAAEHARVAANLVELQYGYQAQAAQLQTLSGVVNQQAQQVSDLKATAAAQAAELQRVQAAKAPGQSTGNAPTAVKSVDSSGTPQSE